MKETLYGSHGLDETRICRAFGWVVTFRDFPVGCWQTVDGESMVSEALTLFTKGRAEFYLNGVRRNDRVPGILSSEHEVDWQAGEFTLKYVEPTTRVCIPAKINKGKLPTVSKLMLQQGEIAELNGKYLVCLGSVSVDSKCFVAEKTLNAREIKTAVPLSDTILLRFHDSR